MFNDGNQEFENDLMEIVSERHKKGHINRRDFLKAMGALGILSSVPGLSKIVNASAKELVVVNWGGDASKVLKEVMADTYKAETGVGVVIDGSGPSGGKIRAMVESGKVVWDICDSGAGTALTLYKNDLITPINYNIVDKTKVLPQVAYFFGVGNYTYSNVLAYNPKMLGGKVPKTWADVWDVKKFPGKRTFRKSVRGMLESATMARGVPREKVYDALSTEDGIKASIEKFRELREHIIIWNSGSQSQNLFLQEEVAMGCIWSSRAFVLQKEMPKGTFDMTFDGGVLTSGIWIVPKNNPAGADEAMKFIRHAQKPELQARWLELMGAGPANPAAAKFVPKELRKLNPSDPQNIENQVFYDVKWYAKNQVKAEEFYVDAMIN